MISIQVGGTIAALEAAFRDLVQADRRNRAYAAAINHTGDRVVMKAVRYAAAKTQLPVRYVKTQVRTYPAGPAKLTWEMVAKGPYITLYKFAQLAGGSARQTAKGVIVPKWGMHRHAFVAGMKTGHIGVFARKGKSRLPIKQLYGPAVPKPLLEDEARTLLEQEVDTRLSARMLHELGREIDRIKAARGV
ncbi:phage tail protein [Labrys wisconsinensis]|uniref:Prophage minor tail protein Z (GPZ) n=1 Tax=Labrys wisconsinensis TaxID=425677 RepID=A0ABU0JEU6_9HYPH|nr:phage tail protein [Labrys wisconsinensis]MDQ0472803.1 hypothetical protein [Labrys wisconsinensis]